MRIGIGLTLVFSLLALACGGGGGGGVTASAPSAGQAPAIANFSLNPNSAVLNDGGGSISSILSVDFNDPDGDVTTVQLTSGGQSQQTAVSGTSGQTHGTLQGTVQFNTTQIGQFPIAIALIDSKGHTSNALSTTFTVAATPGPAPTISQLNPQSVVVGGPAFTLTVQGTNFQPDSQVYWNGSPRTTTYLSGSLLQGAILASDITTAGIAKVSVVNPTIEGGASIQVSLPISNLQLRTVGTTVNDIAWDPLRSVIYASTPSTAGVDGNSIQVINPSTGAILQTVFAGSEPDRLAISSDQQYLYVGLDGANCIKRFLLPSLTPDITLPLGSDSFLGPYFALDLQAAPGLPHTVAVSLGCKGVSPASIGGIIIFDDATPRPTRTLGFQGSGDLFDSIQWGPDASAMFAANTESTGFDFYLLSVDASGISLTKDLSSSFNSFRNAICFEPVTGLIYSGSGPVLDQTGLLVGTYPASGSMVPNPDLNEAFFLIQDYSQTGWFTLTAFHLTHFTPLASVPVPWPLGSAFPNLPARFIRCGSGVLASGGAGNPLYLYSGPFVSAVAAPAAEGQPGLDLGRAETKAPPGPLIRLEGLLFVRTVHQ